MVDPELDCCSNNGDEGFWFSLYDLFPDLVLEAEDVWHIFRGALLESIDYFLIGDVMEKSSGLLEERVRRGVYIGFHVGKPGCCKENHFVFRVGDPDRVPGVWTRAFEDGDSGLVYALVPGVESPEVCSWFDQGGKLFCIEIFGDYHLVVELFSGNVVLKDNVLGCVGFYPFPGLLHVLECFMYFAIEPPGPPCQVGS